MTYDVILRKKDNKYVARIRDWPELVVEESTRDAALSQMKAQLVEYLSNPPEIVKIDVDPQGQENPWLRFAGMWADDPTWDEFVAEVDTYRQEIDEANPCMTWPQMSHIREDLERHQLTRFVEQRLIVEVSTDCQNRRYHQQSYPQQCEAVQPIGGLIKPIVFSKSLPKIQIYTAGKAQNRRLHFS